MSEFLGTVTLKGQQKIAASVGGTALNLTTIRVGDGNGSPITPNEAMTDLVRRVGSAYAILSSGKDPIDPTKWRFTTTIPETDGPFDIREIAIFDAAGDMIAIAKHPLVEKRSTSQGAAVALTTDIVFAISETAQVAITLSPDAAIDISRLLRMPFLVVESVTTTAPPASPPLGATYLIPSGATGAWSGFAQRVAQWNGTVWVTVTPPLGHLVVVGDQALGAGLRWLRREATGWVAATATEAAIGLTRLATIAEHTAGTSDVLAAHPKGVKAMIDAAISALVNGAPVTLDTLKEIADTLTTIFATAAEHLAGTRKDRAATPGDLAPVVTRRAWEYGTNSGTANAWAVTLAPAPTAYTDGMRVSVLLNAANAAGAISLNVNALGNKVVAYDNGAHYAPQAGDFRSGMVVDLIYRGTFFAIVGVSQISVASAIQDCRHNYVGAAGTANAIVIDPQPRPTAHKAGSTFRVYINAANTGAVTLDIQGLNDPKPVTYDGSNVIAAGDFQPNDIVELTYDGTAYRCLTMTRRALSSARFSNPYLGFHGDPVQTGYPPGINRVTSYTNQVNNLPGATESNGIITIARAGYYNVTANLESLMPDTSGSYGYAISVSRVDANGTPLQSIAALSVLVSAQSAQAAQAGSSSGIRKLNAGDRIAAFLQHNLPSTTVQQKVSLDVEFRGA